jgi:uncharacterized protein
VSKNNGIKHEVEHFEIPADNVDGLRNFYSSLFGWEFEEGEKQGYYMIKNAGISGARVVKDRQEISEGYYAVLEDPQKNTIGIWQNK